MQIRDLPDGASAVACDAVGRTVSHAGLELHVPPPGHGVAVEALYPNGAESFGIRTDASGTVSYQTEDELEPASAAEPESCRDDAFNLHGEEQYGPWH